MLQYIVLLGAALQMVGIYSYIRDTLRGDTKPNRVTWLMWAIAPLIASAAALSVGVSWAVLPVFVSGFGPFLVFVASFANKNSYWKLEKFDYLCGGFSILALILWAISGNALIAIFFAILSDAAAALPTLIKAWRFPETESAGPFTFGILNCLTGFVAIQTWTFSSWAFLAYLLVINISIAAGILRKKLGSFGTDA